MTTIHLNPYKTNKAIRITCVVLLILLFIDMYKGITGNIKTLYLGCVAFLLIIIVLGKIEMVRSY